MEKSLEIFKYSEFPLALSSSAKNKIMEILSDIEDQTQGLRIGLQGGGCAGFKYLFEVGTKDKDDFFVEESGVKIWLDPVSAGYLENALLDYESNLFSSQFVIKNTKSSGTCGCGQSVAF